MAYEYPVDHAPYCAEKAPESCALSLSSNFSMFLRLTGRQIQKEAPLLGCPAHAMRLGSPRDFQVHDGIGTKPGSRCRYSVRLLSRNVVVRRGTTSTY